MCREAKGVRKPAGCFRWNPTEANLETNTASKVIFTDTHMDIRIAHKYNVICLTRLNLRNANSLINPTATQNAGQELKTLEQIGERSFMPECKWIRNVSF